MPVLVITLERHSLILTTFIIPVFSQFRDIGVNTHFWPWVLIRPQTLIRPYRHSETSDKTILNSKSMQPITKLGTINALQGLKRPQETVVRLTALLKYVSNYFHFCVSS